MSNDAEAATPYEQAQQQSTDDPARCAIPWGVCPEHGATVRASAGRSSCTDLACLNSWAYDRLDEPCPEPATHTVRADDGGRYGVCNGHAIAARAQLVGGQVLPGRPDSH